MLYIPASIGDYSICNVAVFFYFFHKKFYFITFRLVFSLNTGRILIQNLQIFAYILKYRLIHFKLIFIVNFAFASNIYELLSKLKTFIINIFQYQKFMSKKEMDFTVDL